MSAKESLASLALQTRAYDALNDYFMAHEDEVVEIEILPPAIKPVNGVLMIDRLNMGIPKSILTLAYLHARQLFFENRSGGDGSVSSVYLHSVLSF